MTENANGRLLALLICRPSEFSGAQLDAWLREAWFADADPVVASAGWALTTERVGERLEVLKDYPTPPSCTSPFAPIWIRRMVSHADAEAPT